MSEIEKAENIAIELCKKREALAARGMELSERRMKLAFSAHTGDEAARKQLDQINREAALQGSELRSLDCAISEAELRVEKAKENVRRERDRLRAEKVSKLAGEITETMVYDFGSTATSCGRIVAVEVDLVGWNGRRDLRCPSNRGRRRFPPPRHAFNGGSMPD